MQTPCRPTSEAGLVADGGPNNDKAELPYQVPYDATLYSSGFFEKLFFFVLGIVVVQRSVFTRITTSRNQTHYPFDQKEKEEKSIS